MTICAQPRGGFLSRTTLLWLPIFCWLCPVANLCQCRGAWARKETGAISWARTEQRLWGKRNKDKHAQIAIFVFYLRVCYIFPIINRKRQMFLLKYKHILFHTLSVQLFWVAYAFPFGHFWNVWTLLCNKQEMQRTPHLPVTKVMQLTWKVDIAKLPNLTHLHFLTLHARKAPCGGRRHINIFFCSPLPSLGSSRGSDWQPQRLLGNYLKRGAQEASSTCYSFLYHFTSIGVPKPQVKGQVQIW